MRDSYHLLDEFSGHKCTSVVHSINFLGTDVDFIPPKCTGQAQVLDVGINHTFKYFVRKRHDDYIAKEGAKKHKRLDVASWISTSWKEITIANVKNTWRKVGII